MGSMTQHYKDVEAQHKKDRAEQAKANQKQMDDLAKIRPTPTLEEVQAAQAGKTRRNEVDTPPSDPPPTPGWAVPAVEAKKPVVEAKTSEPEVTSTSAGSYKTRASKKSEE